MKNKQIRKQCSVQVDFFFFKKKKVNQKISHGKCIMHLSFFENLGFLYYIGFLYYRMRYFDLFLKNVFMLLTNCCSAEKKIKLVHIYVKRITSDNK